MPGTVSLVKLATTSNLNSLWLMADSWKCRWLIGQSKTANCKSNKFEQLKKSKETHRKGGEDTGQDKRN